MNFFPPGEPMALAVSAGAGLIAAILTAAVQGVRLLLDRRREADPFETWEAEIAAAERSTL